MSASSAPLSSAPSASSGPRPPSATAAFPMINGAGCPTASSSPQTSATSSSSWSSLKSCVRESRRTLSGSSSSLIRTPTQFAFRSLGDVLRTRLYFLSSLGAKESTLLYVDMDDSAPFVASDSQLPWNSLIEQSFQVIDTSIMYVGYRSSFKMSFFSGAAWLLEAQQGGAVDV